MTYRLKNTALRALSVLLAAMTVLALLPRTEAAAGWERSGGGWYYADADGARRTGWVKSGGRWYYLDPDTGRMQTGWLTVEDDGTYYLDDGGAMVTGWKKLSGAWYYFQSSGQMQTGWVKVGGRWYYLDPDTAGMQTGWLTLEDGVYYLNSSGAMATGWKKFGDDWYYFPSSGRMKTGWASIDNDTYYFYQKDDPNGGVYGVMAYSTEIDGTEIKESGAAVTQTELDMIAYAQKKKSPTKYLVLVDTSACKVGVFYRADGAWELIRYWNCAPGKPSTPTVKGTFTVKLKGYYFDSGSARCFYYTQFYGNYLFHSVLCYRDGSIMDGRVGMQLSHGCVRLAVGNAKWIYDNIPAGTTVYIY